MDEIAPVDRLDQFNALRPLLFSIAYRMLGTVMEAEDIVQEAYLRWERTPLKDIESPKAYLSAIVTRLCIDTLRSAQAQREVYPGPWLPEPLLIDLPGGSPLEEMELSDTLSMAFLVLLESLSPDERAVFLLREVFDYQYTEIATIVGKSEEACRQIASRAKNRIAAGRPRFDITREQQERVTMQFAASLMTGDIDSLLAVLADDVTSWSDGGGRISAARRPIHGADRVARFFLGLMRKAPPSYATRPTFVNGAPGFVNYIDGAVHSVIVLDIAGNKVIGIRTVVNPDKLRHIPPLSQ